MEAIVSAVLGDLISRSISFAIDRYCHRRQEATVQENLQRLRRVLLRIQVTVEEAERRCVTNQAMLRQLHLMREGMYRGYYLVNAVMSQEQPRGREVSRHEHSSLALSLSEEQFNPAKRICILPSRRTTTTTVTAPYTGREAEVELQEALVALERMAGDMKEFVLFLSGYPPRLREPYSRHLRLENRMFGREAEYESIIRFLLEPEPAGARDLAVLPVIGRPRIGKSTLVEHVCRDEMVRKHFSLIVFFGESDIVGENLRLVDSGVIKYRNDLASTTGSSLVVIELLGAVDESTWRRTLSALKSEHTAPVSKILVTGRSEMVASFGTMKALELKPLSREAFWYYFKTMAFGSTTDAEEQPELAAVCMEMADLFDGSFIVANIFGGLLRNNICAGYWQRVLKRFKDQRNMHLQLFGESPILRLAKDQPAYLWRLFKNGSLLIAYRCYQASSVQQPDLPKITVKDFHTGSTMPRGEFEALAWRSCIPPYSSYLFRCGVQTPSSSLRRSPRNKQLQQVPKRLTSI